VPSTPCITIAVLGLFAHIDGDLPCWRPDLNVQSLPRARASLAWLVAAVQQIGNVQHCLASRNVRCNSVASATAVAG